MLAASRGAKGAKSKGGAKAPGRVGVVCVPTSTEVEGGGAVRCDAVLSVPGCCCSGDALPSARWLVERGVTPCGAPASAKMILQYNKNRSSD
jgi:hypothetical protein